MSKLILEIGQPIEFRDSDRQDFLALLRKQDKVDSPTIDRVNRCRLLCFYRVNEKIVSIGAIKPKTKTDFGKKKANVQEFQSQIDYELGYCFTLPEHTRKGYSSSIVQSLLKKSEGQNLMASTELREGNSMTRILETNGFKRVGKIWKSRHGYPLSLFFRFINSNQ